MPCLPVDSATSCSSHSPRPGSESRDHERQLVAPGPRERAQRRAEPHAPALCRPLRRPAPSSPSAVSQARRAPRSSARDVDADQRRRARCRTATARCSARRCRGRRRRRARKPCSCASCSRPEPGSVIATKFEPSPTQRPEVGEQRQRLDRAAGLRGDEEQRALRVDRSLRPRAIVAASVESSTCRRGRPALRAEGAPQHLRRQRGAAHAEQHDVAQPVVAHPVGERLELVAARRASARRSSASRAGWRPPACRRAPTASRLAAAQPRSATPLLARRRAAISVDRRPVSAAGSAGLEGEGRGRSRHDRSRRAALV